MPKTASPYPKLEYYLASVRVADFVYAVRRPENWIRWTLIVVLCVIQTTFGWMWAGAAFVVAFAIMTWLRKRMTGDKTLPQAIAEAARAQLPSRMRKLLKQGKLAERVGEDGAAALERCASYAVAAQAEQVRATMFVLGPTGQLELRKEISAAITSSMNHAFACFETNLMGPMFARPVDIAEVAESERELEKLASEVAAWADSLQSKSVQPDLSPIREQLRAMRDMEVGFQTGEIVAGHSDLESQARKRE